MNETSGRALRIIGGLALSLALPGCVGYVQGDGSGVVMTEPDFYFFGGDYGWSGRDRDYGRRGAESRGSAGRSGGARAARPAAAVGGHEYESKK